MVDSVKGVLLIDLDGLGRSLTAAGGEAMDERLAERIDDWQGAIESGELFTPSGTRHEIAERRCYVGSAGPAAARAAFEQAGFDIIECDGQAQAEISLAVDAMDTGADAEDDLTFILLTAAPDLTPLVERLQARGHHVAVYAGEATAAAYKDAADMVIPAGDLVALLATSKVPVPAAPPLSAADRDRIEAFAREVHTATNIPMFSPRTFAELFRVLAAEVAEHGYHFNETAKNVAEQLAGAGRNVTARQVVFVVKGLALKGHVFSTNDTAERLAEVFCEQARYLIGGAGIALDAKREALLTAWIAAPTASAAKPARAPEPAATPRPARKPAPVRSPERPAAAKPASPPRVPERPKSPALAAKAAPPPEPAKPSKTTTDLRATIAARIAASAKMKPSAHPPLKAEAPAPAPRKPPPDAPAEEEDAIESSILAAIAEAVDVLVEDGGSQTAEPAPEPQPEREARPSAVRRAPEKRPQAEEPPPPPQEEEAEEEGGDIGDEIQRIVASYNRNRDDDRRG